jgi:hypothetical protein
VEVVVLRSSFVPDEVTDCRKVVVFGSKGLRVALQCRIALDVVSGLGVASECLMKERCGLRVEERLLYETECHSALRARTKEVVNKIRRRMAVTRNSIAKFFLLDITSLDWVSALSHALKQINKEQRG